MFMIGSDERICRTDSPLWILLLRTELDRISTTLKTAGLPLFASSALRKRGSRGTLSNGTLPRSGQESSSSAGRRATSLFFTDTAATFPSPIRVLSFPFPFPPKLVCLLLTPVWLKTLPTTPKRFNTFYQFVVPELRTPLLPPSAFLIFNSVVP